MNSRLAQRSISASCPFASRARIWTRLAPGGCARARVPVDSFDIRPTGTTMRVSALRCTPPQETQLRRE
jgi:hypothetical protein